MTNDEALLILCGFLVVALLLIVAIFIQAGIHKSEGKRQRQARDLFYARYYDSKAVNLPLFIKPFFDVLLDIETQIQIEPDIRERIVLDLLNRSFTKRQFRHLKHPLASYRQVAISYVAALKTEHTYRVLHNRLYKEKNAPVRFMLAYALRDRLSKDDFDFLFDFLDEADSNFGKWLVALIKNRYDKYKVTLTHYMNDSRLEVRALLLEIANQVYDPLWRDYCLFVLTQEGLAQLHEKALLALLNQHPSELVKNQYLNHPSETIRRYAIRATSSQISEEMVTRLINDFDGTTFDQDRVSALSRIIYDSKSLLLKVLAQYPLVKSKPQKDGITRVLAHHVDYLIVRMSQNDYRYIESIIANMLELHIIEDLIDFINQNHADEVIKYLLEPLKKAAASDTYLLDQFCIYLNDRTLASLGLLRKPKPQTSRPKATLDKGKRRWIISWIIVGIVLFPFLTFLFEIRNIFESTTPFTLWVVRLNHAVVFYFLTANGVYLLLLAISLFGAFKTERLWRIKRNNLLFEHGLLPMISIIAPAYNEQLSITESITSLLNLKYPSYEVIVVNDGSKDKTIEVLIEHFKLERKHPFFTQALMTQPLRGVYVNPLIPNLIVIDKENGGKADALNMGINASKGGYVCGIDADSLLEENALLKLMSVTLDDDIPHLALGGNIIPVNGSLVDRGKIEHSGLGKKTLVRFQTLEYLRAFTSGRIGWSELRSLLIISGAFGIFKREELLETGGYLTVLGKLKKDTVGEDMELVVRLTYQALLDKRYYRVSYVHHANCYTELPSDLNSLLKQRNRWQRGLLDILSLHRRILLRPQFKQPGMLGFPYFFMFEMMGPFIEGVGYLAILLGLAMNLLNLPLVILLFAVTIGFGLVISLFSLFISERKSTFYSIKDVIVLVFFCILENFGFRQLMSLHRIKATFSALKETGNWGSQNRQGFQKK